MKSEFIFEKAPFKQCHASTIVETEQGFVAAWFGGTQEKNKDVSIWLARHRDGSWSAPVEVANGVEGASKRYPCWNPVLFQPATGPLWLFYKMGPDPSTWWGMLIESSDAGKSWSKPRRLPEGILGPIKNKPVQLANGDLICSSSTEDHGWRVHFERTTDLGRTWQATEPLNDGRKIGAIQPTILILGNNQLLALGRSRQKRIFEIDSSDGGKTWGEMRLTDLPNPNSGIDAVTLKDGRHVLVYNHTTIDRSPLNMAISPDGKSWQAALVLENSDGEFSYPAVIQSIDGLIHSVYTWKRERVKHVVIDPAKLGGPQIRAGKWPQ